MPAVQQTNNIVYTLTAKQFRPSVCSVKSQERLGRALHGFECCGAPRNRERQPHIETDSRLRILTRQLRRLPQALEVLRNGPPQSVHLRWHASFEVLTQLLTMQFDAPDGVRPAGPLRLEKTRD